MSSSTGHYSCRANWLILAVQKVRYHRRQFWKAGQLAGKIGCGGEFNINPAGQKEGEKAVGSKIQKRGNSYFVRVELPTGPDGERNQATITDTSSKALERRQRELLRQIDQGHFSVASTKMALGEFFDFCLSIIKGKAGVLQPPFDSIR